LCLTSQHRTGDLLPVGRPGTAPVSSLRTVLVSVLAPITRSQDATSWPTTMAARSLPDASPT
jgi:hypothetical protein